MRILGRLMLLLLMAAHGGNALGQTINIDVKPSSSGIAYSGSDGVLSSGGSFWNHSVSNAANLAYEDGSASGVSLGLLQQTGWSIWLSATKIFSAGIGLYGAYDDFPARYGIYDIDPYKTYDVVIYYGRGSGSGNAYGVGTIYDATGASWDMCSADSDNLLPGTADRTYLRFTGVLPYEVSSNRYGIRLEAEKHTTASDQVTLAGIQIKNTGTRANIAPHFPSLVSPTNNATGIGLAPTLQATAFSDPDAGDTHANSQWQVDNNSAFSSPEWDSGTNAALTIVTVPSSLLGGSTIYYWRVRYRDSAGNWSPYSSAFSFRTLIPNNTPTNILLSSTNVPENLPASTTVGHFTSQDPDTGNTFTYTLVAGTGSGDNGSFSVTGSNLLTATMFNYEVKSSYSIRVQSADQGGLSTQKVFAINITNVDEPPPSFSEAPSLSGSNMIIRWGSITNHKYTVQYSTNLLKGFAVLQSNISGTPPINVHTDSVTTATQKYWKVTTDP